MNKHSSDESELGEASIRGHEARIIYDNLKIEYDNQRTQQKRRIIIEQFDIKLHNRVIFANPKFS